MSIPPASDHTMHDIQGGKVDQELRSGGQRALECNVCFFFSRIVSVNIQKVWHSRSSGRHGGVSLLARGEPTGAGGLRLGRASHWAHNSARFLSSRQLSAQSSGIWGGKVEGGFWQ